MRDDIAQAIKNVKVATPTTPEMIDAARAIYADAHKADQKDDVRIERDIAYGAHPRQQLDIFTVENTVTRPVVIFVPGGGFVRGEKNDVGTPYYSNVGQWATRSGFVGVTMNYRLAPEFPYPAGGEDVAAAVAWCRAHIAEYGGDPEAIVLLGQSAGSTHVATYGARPDLHVRPGGGVLGIALMSGVYDFSSFEDMPNVRAYVGTTSESQAAASSLSGLVASNIRLLISIAEHDTAAFHEQAWRLARGLYERDERWPNVLYLSGHSHLSQIMHLGASGIDDPTLSNHLVDFVQSALRAMPVAGQQGKKNR